MKLFQLGDLRALTEPRQGPCVSLYLPTYRAGRDTRENAIRLKNAVGGAREQLREAGYLKNHTAEILEPMDNLLASWDFWLHQADGLAVFLAPGLFRYYRVPVKLQDEVVVSDHFSVRQLIPLFTEDGRFYILALSQKQVRFFDATRGSIHERAVPDMLKSIDDLRQFNDTEEQVHVHTMSVTQGGTAEVAFHGHGNIADKAWYKAEVQRYVNAVGKKLDRYLGAETAPLVLAAVEYMQSFYRQASAYHHLLEGGVLGNPDDLAEEQIHRAAWAIAEPHFAVARRISLKHFADLSGTGRTSDQLEEILPAARHGRVRTLYLQTQEHIWGKFDTDGSRIETHDHPRPGDVDLIDLAALHVLQNRGTVYALPPEEMPARTRLAAMFRY